MLLWTFRKARTVAIYYQNVIEMIKGEQENLTAFVGSISPCDKGVQQKSMQILNDSP